jgi:glutaminyl-tRNA synthetase
VKDADGEVVEIHCTYDPATRGGNTPDGRKVKSTIHWVPAAQAVDFEARLYESLFNTELPDAAADTEEGHDFTANLNPNSLQVRTGKIEPSVREAVPGQRFQFERVGYFCMDRDSTRELPVFNRTVPLRDTWAKIEKKG